MVDGEAHAGNAHGIARKVVAMQRIARATLQGVAAAAGVDKSTASRALRDDPAISLATRERVQQVAALLHYVPNANARRLSQARSHVLAFFTQAFHSPADPSNPFLMELLAAITQEATARQFDILLVSSEAEAYEREVAAFERIIGGNHADGLVLMDLRAQDQRLAHLCARQYPHVLFGRSDEDLRLARRYPYPWVEVDNRLGTRTGMEYLIAEGHRRIAFIGGTERFICDRDRHAGYREALASAGILADPALFMQSDVTEAAGYQLTRQLLTLEQPPTAIVAFSDVMAVGVMRAAQDMVHPVGRDLALIGFDGLGIGKYLMPSLTTLSQPLHQVGQAVVQLLIAQLNGDAVAEPHVLLAPELIIRDSSRTV